MNTLSYLRAARAGRESAEQTMRLAKLLNGAIDGLHALDKRVRELERHIQTLELRALKCELEREKEKHDE